MLNHPKSERHDELQNSWVVLFSFLKAVPFFSVFNKSAKEACKVMLEIMTVVCDNEDILTLRDNLVLQLRKLTKDQDIQIYFDIDAFIRELTNNITEIIEMLKENLQQISQEMHVLENNSKRNDPINQRLSVRAQEKISSERKMKIVQNIMKTNENEKESQQNVYLDNETKKMLTQKQVEAAVDKILNASSFTLDEENFKQIIETTSNELAKAFAINDQTKVKLILNQFLTLFWDELSAKATNAFKNYIIERLMEVVKYYRDLFFDDKKIPHHKRILATEIHNAIFSSIMEQKLIFKDPTRQQKKPMLSKQYEEEYEDIIDDVEAYFLQGAYLARFYYDCPFQVNSSESINKQYEHNIVLFITQFEKSLAILKDKLELLPVNRITTSYYKHHLSELQNISKHMKSFNESRNLLDDIKYGEFRDKFKKFERELLDKISARELFAHYIKYQEAKELVDQIDQNKDQSEWMCDEYLKLLSLSLDLFKHVYEIEPNIFINVKIDWLHKVSTRLEQLNSIDPAIKLEVSKEVYDVILKKALDMSVATTIPPNNYLTDQDIKTFEESKTLLTLLRFKFDTYRTIQIPVFAKSSFIINSTTIQSGQNQVDHNTNKKENNNNYNDI